ncbi:MAG: TerC/Alx family metal homeostasis membrane protein [Ignavibacteriales bacterium]|nr:TerC/Alx family metal homeostasis membrane protein [Ignavibacteriales bacterium]
MNTHFFFWIAFISIFIIVFSIDMFVTNHRDGRIKIKTALMWTGIWISVALFYGVSIYFFFPEGKLKAFEFIAGYLTEYSLSIDNLFVFIMIFSVMGITENNQPKMLKIGILLSIFLRIVFILFGVELIHRFHFFIYIFGVVLIYTAYKMAFMDDNEIEPEKNMFYRATSKYFKIETKQDGFRFFLKKGGNIYATTLFLIFILIGTTDIVFAMDSIPAILGITQDSFIVITSNVFAVLGLISLFFALEGIMHMFRFLKSGVAFILLFVGIKMLISKWYQIPIITSLGFIILTLLISVLVSIIIKESKPEPIRVKNEESRFNS